MKGTSKQRLAHYRKQAANSKFASAKDWRYWKQSITSTPNNARSERGDIYTDSVDQYGDNVGQSHEIISRLDHTGWFADTFQDALVCGSVCRMRSSKGTYYIPVTSSTGWDGTIHYFSDLEFVSKGSNEDAHEDAMKDAARSADHYAERDAEEAREHDAKYLAEQQIEGKREEIHSINQKTLALIREVKAAKGFSPSVCQVIREAIEEALESRKECFNRIDELQDNYWNAVETY